MSFEVRRALDRAHPHGAAQRDEPVALSGHDVERLHCEPTISTRKADCLHHYY